VKRIYARAGNPRLVTPARSLVDFWPAARPASPGAVLDWSVGALAALFLASLRSPPIHTGETSGGRHQWIVNLVDRQLEAYEEPVGRMEAEYRRRSVHPPGNQAALRVNDSVVSIDPADLLP